MSPLGVAAPEACFDYPRHFILLAAAMVVLACLSRFPIYESAVFASASNGALHAVTLTASLRASARFVRKLLFVAIASALSVMSLYVGIIALVALSMLPDSERLPAVIAIGAVSGAITYGSLVRMFWMRSIRPRVILNMAMICGVATLAGYIAKLKFDWAGMWWIAAIWWLTFSLALRLLTKPR